LDSHGAHFRKTEIDFAFSAKSADDTGLVALPGCSEMPVDSKKLLSTEALMAK